MRFRKKNAKGIKKRKIFFIIAEKRPPSSFGGRFSSYLGNMKRFEENTCLCTLNRIFGFDPKTAHALLARVGDAG